MLYIEQFFVKEDCSHDRDNEPNAGIAVITPRQYARFVAISLAAVSLARLDERRFVICSPPTRRVELTRGSGQIIKRLEQQYPPKPDLWLDQPLPQAIVVLGAGRNHSATEYNGRMSSSVELERLNYAAYLYRQTHLPILISGSSSEIGYMKDVLANTYQVPVRWQESHSHTTWENAMYSDELLTRESITSAWVVTQAWHMPRAMQAFANRRIHYYPASVTYGSSTYWQHRWMLWIPQANALSRSQTALHEWFGLLKYQWH